MTAVFLMYLAETLSEMCSAQGEQSGQPNHMGSGQNRCAASIHCLAPALALVKREDGTGGCENAWKSKSSWTNETQLFLRHREKMSPPRYRLHGQEWCWHLILPWHPILPPFLRSCSLCQNLNPIERKPEARQQQSQMEKSNLFLLLALGSFAPKLWRVSSDLLILYAYKKALWRKYLCSAIFF